MSILYDTINELCAQKGITGYRLCKDIGISPSLLSDLKAGRKNGMKADTAEKMASYFGVTVTQLLGKTDIKKAPPLETETPYDDEALELMEEMHKRPELRALFSASKGAKKEDIDAINQLLKSMAGEESDV